MISDFHFLRPLWLLLLIIPVVLIFFVRRRRDLRKQWQDVIAPHLLDALIINGDQRQRMLPCYLLALVLVFLTLAIAGPSWYKEQPPFVEDSASLIIVVDLSQSMDAVDIKPSRIERVKLKIHDILERRAGARTAVIAYAGTAHLVVPLTSDTNLITSYTDVLNTGIMPRQGKNSVAALNKAAAFLDQDGSSGTILFMTDGVEKQAIETFSTKRNEAIIVLEVSAETGAGRSAEAGSDALAELRSQTSAEVTSVTDDDSDVLWILKRIRANFLQQQSDDSSRWHDSGWWFVLLASALFALNFRRGWVIRMGLTCLAFQFVAIDYAKADRLADMWLTHDQQGRRAFERHDYKLAETLFEDLMWRGVSAYRAGNYKAALDAFSNIDGTDALYNQGNALLHLGRFSEAVSAYEAALKTRPTFTDAEINLATAKRLLAESLKQEQDEAQDPNLKPDGVVIDDKAKKGKAGEVALAQQSTELWIKNITVSPAVMLARRFALEVEGGQK